jgi:hypothetical protein
MRSRRLAWQRSGRMALIAAAIVSLIHAPLPQPDFHTIRHHHAPGQVCEKHDHLLLWHPDAAISRDVAVLHWHWFLPTTSGTDTTPSDSRHALHAHLPDWQAEACDHAPQVVPDRESTRLVAKLASTASAPLDLPPVVTRGLTSSSDGSRPPLAFCATFAPGAKLTSLLHRWTC